MNKNTKLEERMKEDQIASIGIGAMIVFIALILVAAVASAVIIQTGEKLQQNAQQTGSDTQEEIGGKINIITVWVGDQSDCDGDGDGDGIGNANDEDEEDVCITLVYELAAGSEQMTEDQVHWSITCLDDPNAANPNLQKIWGTFDGFPTNLNAYAGANTIPTNTMNLDTVNVDGSQKFVNEGGVIDDAPEANDDDEDTLNPGQVYMISIKTNGDTQEVASDNNGVSDAPEQAQGECNPTLNEQHSLTISVVGGGTTIEILSYTSTDEGAQVV